MSTNVETASPLLTMLARYIILPILCQQSWNMIAADVESACLQTKDIREQGVRIFSIPTKDIRIRLAKLMNLKDDEILQMLKHAFGYVRAPKQWNQTVTEALIDIGFLNISWIGVVFCRTVLRRMATTRSWYGGWVTARTTSWTGFWVCTWTTSSVAARTWGARRT
eukprot:8438988-Pyramimonas_sp.AAC.1